jgi:putative flippase GtrA
MKKLAKSALQNRFVRFLGTGGINTAITYLIYLILLRVMNYQLSYTITYITGIILAFFLNRRFVFRTHRGWKSILLYPLVYVFQYLFGMLVLWFIVNQLAWSAKLGPLFVVVLSVPLTYLLSKFIFVGRESKSD